MKTRVLLSIMIVGLMLNLKGQSFTYELSFTGIHGTDHIQMDSIKIFNNTNGGDTVLYWPDTVLVLDYMGIPEINQSPALKVFQNIPNPVKDKTTISIYVPKKEQINLSISDIIGHQLINKQMELEKGYHSFSFTPGSSEVYFLTAISKENKSSIKIVNAANSSNKSCSLEHLESNLTVTEFKSLNKLSGFEFYQGDELLFIGYQDILESGMLDIPEESKTYTFQFASGIPCPGTPMVTYEGQDYTTVQIGSQCWFQENLNVGTIVSWSQENNGVVEKFCYNDDETYCEMYGGLYQWNEMMLYDTTPGIQGICPDGWHIPTDNEWKILEGAIDSEYSIGNPHWDTIGFRGYDAATKIKSNCGWINMNGTDNFNFSMLAPGIWHCNGYFEKYTVNGRFWTSDYSTGVNAWGRSLYYNKNNIYRNQNGNRNSGFSVRCLKDISAE